MDKCLIFDILMVCKIKSTRINLCGLQSHPCFYYFIGYNKGIDDKLFFKKKLMIGKRFHLDKQNHNAWNTISQCI